MKDQIKNILQKAKQESASSEDMQELRVLFHQPDKEFELKEQLLEELNEIQTNEIEAPDINRIFLNLWSKIENAQRQKPVISLPGILKIAAILVVGLFLGILAERQLNPAEPVYYEAFAPKGSVSEVILPDSSVIYLNAGSHIRYSMSGVDQSREVFLTGEAWFNVEKNKSVPFIVHSLLYDVKVTGTKFNVKSYPDDDLLTTTLEEGQVIISSNGNFKLAEDVVLKPGEQAVLNKNSKEFTIKNVNTKWYTSWKDNKLIFINTSLGELEVLLERRYGVEIEILNNELLDLHFDGTIKNESIVEILEIIKKTLPINYRIAGQKIEITNKKQ